MPEEPSEAERAARRERRLAYARAYYQANKARLQEQARANYHASRETRLAGARAYAQAHQDQKREYDRAYRERRRKQNLCARCGEPIPFLLRSRWKGVCRACRAKKMAKEAERRAAILRAELEAYGKTACPRCGGTNAARLSHPHQGKAFRCRDCAAARRRDIAPLPGPNPFPCPYCRCGCRKLGCSRNGSRRFVCTACGRFNTLLRPNPKPAGPLRHRFMLYLGLASNRRLKEYCDAHGLRAATAVREICRKYAYPAHGRATRQTIDPWGEPVTVATPIRSVEKPPPLRFTETPLPDARPVQMKARWEEKKRLELYGNYMPRAVAVVRLLLVRLDDESWEGLHRIMEINHMTHQDAARWMICQQPAPDPASLSKP